MVRLSTIYISLVIGIIVYSSSIQAKPHEACVHSLVEAIPFQCLLNIPMGSSPGEVKRHLSNCQSVKLYDINDQNMSQGLDLSSYINQVLFDINIQTYSEGQDSLQYLTFSFFKGALYSIEGTKFFDYETAEEKTKDIASQFQEQYGKPKLITKTVYWQTEKWTEKTPNWKIGTKTLSFDTYSSPPEGYLTIKNDSISKIVKEILGTYVDVEVFTYNGYDKKKKLSKREWYSENPEQLQGILTQCEGIGKIALKGNGKGLTFRIQCENGNTVFEKEGINIGSKSNTVLTNFPENCEDKVMRKEVDRDIYGALFYLIVLKNDHEIFKGEITRLDCMD